MMGVNVFSFYDLYYLFISLIGLYIEIIVVEIMPLFRIISSLYSGIKNFLREN